MSEITVFFSEEGDLAVLAPAERKQEAEIAAEILSTNLVRTLGDDAHFRSFVSLREVGADAVAIDRFMRGIFSGNPPQA